MRIISVGHAVFAATLIALGLASLITGHFAAIWQPVSQGIHGRKALIYLCAFVPLACGMGVLWRPTAATAARVLFVFLLLWMVLFKVPYILRAPTVEVNYESCGETAVLVAGAWVLYASCAGGWDRRWLRFAVGERGVHAARALFALALIAFGLSHFAYLDLTAPLVPRWLPAPVGWAYFTGSAYLAAGLAVLSGLWDRLAAALAALQMGLFTVLVWVPVIASGLATAGQRVEFVVSWALTAAAWVVADSYGGAPWLAFGRHWRPATRS